MYASSQGYLDIVKLLLRKKADIEAKDAAEWTPLLFASSEGHLEIVKLLLENKADIDANGFDVDTGAGFMTPIIAAHMRNHNQVFVDLLKNGASLLVLDHEAHPKFLCFSYYNWDFDYILEPESPEDDFSKLQFIEPNELCK